MARRPTAATLLVDNLDELLKDLQTLAETEVLVGFPAETADRDPAPGDPKSPLTNAALGYIHDNGMPEQNIPARPFMLPGMRNAEDKVANILARGARAVLTSGQRRAKNKARTTAEDVLMTAGIAAVSAIKAKIVEGVPPPLADRTLAARARRGRKGAQEELDRRAKGEMPGTGLAKPLIDTAEMLNSVTSVVRSKSERKT